MTLDFMKKISFGLFAIGLLLLIFRVANIIHFIFICFISIFLLFYGLLGRIIELEEKYNKLKNNYDSEIHSLNNKIEQQKGVIKTYLKNK